YAQYHLGGMYDEGRGVPQSYTEAYKWFILAAEQGDIDAQLKLGIMYSEGRGDAQSDIYEHMWINLAAVQGDREARVGREQVAQKMTQAQIVEAQNLASECLAKEYTGC